MGQAVVHFEVVGKDGPGLQRFFADLFGWEVDADNPLGYGSVSREGNVQRRPAWASAAESARARRRRWPRHLLRGGAGRGRRAGEGRGARGTTLFGPDEVPGMGIVLGQFTDPEGHVIGLMQPCSAR